MGLYCEIVFKRVGVGGLGGWSRRPPIPTTINYDAPFVLNTVHRINMYPDCRFSWIDVMRVGVATACGFVTAVLKCTRV
eukprot:SAG11_NODE_98_length_16927_cov_35.166211_15_plen_79_part_00